MKRTIPLVLLLSLLLSGCSWMSNSYVSVKPHQEQEQSGQLEVVVASDYLDLIYALEEMIETGTESGIINVADYPQDALEGGMMVAMRYAMESFPLGAYAVKEINYEVGNNSGMPAVAVTIAYRHSRAELQKIRHLITMNDADLVVAEALNGYAVSVVLLVENYYTVDFTQLVQDYAEAHPESVMETPQVTMGVYGRGDTRVVELTFTYQTGRDSLRQMQNQVKPVFEAASLYVSGDSADYQKYSQLYAFLMERFDYTIETSITPAYSLLRHGVGDSRAFATVYASMCRGAGMECEIVTGTRSGEPWTWNIVNDDGNYFHVDLLRCNEIGDFREFSDNDMSGYVWDYSAYPECPVVYVTEEEQPPVSAETEPTEETSETTEPTQTEEPTEETEETLPLATEETTSATESTENLE